ncbi:rhomboid-like protein [Kitasatospora sp. NPDC048722]|uniref:rhomboid-like protein n=1 Tax=Kitasatospora sp. NPDC048722 TaxID=3155639 RepID=UPI0033CAC9F7
MSHARVSGRTSMLARAVWSYVRRAPGTFVWLAILLGTTLVIDRVSPRVAHHILEKRSTNLHHLEVAPLRVLFSSALWIEGGGWWFYLVLYNVFHVPAERWLGTVRWLAVVLIAHIGATYISEGVLYWAISRGLAPHRAVYTLDVGVSYALAGIVAVLTYALARPWRYVYAAGVVVFYGYGLLHSRDFTSAGHFTAVLIGLACYPFTRGRPAAFDPVAAARTAWRRVRGHGRPRGPRSF